MHLKDEIMPRYAKLIYNGFWFAPEREMLQALIDKSQEHVTGTVRMKLYKGNATVIGRESPLSLYDQDLVTFEEGSGGYDQRDAAGFIRLNALRLQDRGEAREPASGLTGETDLARLLAGLDPELDPVEYGFETVAEAPPLGDAFALIREAEGITVVRPGRGWARITLAHPFQPRSGRPDRPDRLCSGRPRHRANVVAGAHHDHFFVPWQRRAEAMEALRQLARSA